jgi:hypothetical protein
MSVFPEKHFSKFYWAVCLVVLAIVVLRCMLVPFSHDEVATFHFYIQPGSFLPFLSHPDANGHFLMSAGSWVCFKLAGSSPLVLRVPCILGFVVLCFGVFKMNKLFTGLYTRIIFSAAFILSYNFISFYALCRGYGLSMAFLVLALYYFFVYIRFGSFSQLWKFYLFIQLALSANLTLVFVALVTTGMVVVMQLSKKLFFRIPNLLLLLIHTGLLLFWIKFAFFLKEQGALYYGSGESYWAVTFKTLIELLFVKSTWLNLAFVAGFVTMLAYWLYRVVRDGRAFLLTHRFSLAFSTLCILILAFYLLKKLLGVNYPEDRTGMFFYVFYVTSFGLMVNELRREIQIVLLVIPALYLVHFVNHLNFRVHTQPIYETMPAAFFETLKAEQEKTPYRITIGGHRVREFFYGFLNYKSDEKLNHMTSPNELHMNCDYALADQREQPWYAPYYDEIGVDGDWGFRLLKRRHPLQRELLFETTSLADFTGEGEYYNACEIRDTTLGTENPLLAEFEFQVERAPAPFNAWLVLQIDGDDGDQLVRVPLNLVKYDWTSPEPFTLGLVSSNIPRKITRLVAYLWNIDKQEIHIRMNSFRLYRLNGEGAQAVSQAKL